MISAGEVPGLYTPEELEPLLAQLKDEMQSQYEYKTTFEFFVSRVKRNLSIALSLNYQHTKFFSYCASNPALISKCNIIWSEGWSKDSLIQVTRNELHELSDSIGKSYDQIIQSFLIVQNSSNELGASPQSFINLLQQFKHVFNKIVQSSGGQSKHLMAGLEKLEQAKQMVDQLSQEAG